MVLAPHHKPVVSAHQKKAHGQHHHVTKHYTKTYWPYLPLLLIVGFGMVLNTLWSSGKGVLGYEGKVETSALLQQTNYERTSRGETALATNNQLSAAAQAKAEDMVRRNYWSHKTPDNVEPWTFVSNASYKYAAVGENLAYGFDSGSETVVAWMNSPTHKANVLDANYKDVGFGIATANNYQDSGPTTVVVAFYASPAAYAIKSQGTLGYYNTSTLVANAQQDISRVQILTNGNASWSIAAITLLSGVAIMIFVTRHALLWRRVLVRSEDFILRHHHLDVFLVVLGVVGILLMQGVGTIR